jgi:hypothetical protein
LTVSSADETPHGREEPGVQETGGPPAVPTVWELGLRGTNPTTSSVQTELGVPRSRSIKVAVYDVGGRRVVDLLDRVLPEGRHPLEWNGRDQFGRRVSPGVYFVRMTAGDEVRTIKVAVLR